MTGNRRPMVGKLPERLGQSGWGRAPPTRHEPSANDDFPDEPAAYEQLAQSGRRIRNRTIASVTPVTSTKIFNPAKAGTPATAQNPYASDYSFLLNNAQQPKANKGNR
jgi:hypothetical protein